MIPVIVTPEFGKVLHDMVWHCPRVQGDKRPMIEVRCTMHTGEVKILTLAFTYNVMISANENAGPTYLAYFNLISITKPSCDTSGTPNRHSYVRMAAILAVWSTWSIVKHTEPQST